MNRKKRVRRVKPQFIRNILIFSQSVRKLATLASHCFMMHLAKKNRDA